MTVAAGCVTCPGLRLNLTEHERDLRAAIRRAERMPGVTAVEGIAAAKAGIARAKEQIAYHEAEHAADVSA